MRYEKLLFLLVILCFIISCERNHKYGLVVANNFAEEYQEISKNIKSMKIIALPNNSTIDPENYDIGKVFNSFQEIEQYLYTIYNESSNYNNEEIFNKAKETGSFKCIDINNVVRTFLFTENNQIVLIGISNVFNFNDLYPNYYQDEFIMSIIDRDIGQINTTKMNVYFQIKNKIYKGAVWSYRVYRFYIDELIYIKEES